MDFDISIEERTTLEVMYFECLSELERGKRKIADFGNSLLYTLIRVTSNDRAKYLSASEHISVSEYESKGLLDKGLIADGSLPGKYVLTSQGIWAIEKDKVDLNQVFQAINENYFDLTPKLGPNQYIALLSTVVARTFSKSAAITLPNQELMDEWQEIFNLSSDILVQYGIITDKQSTRNRKDGAEHPAIYVIRYTDILPRATWGIFTKPGDYTYYLDVVQDGEICIEKLGRILGLIFGKALTYENRDEIAMTLMMFYSQYMQNIAMESFTGDYGDVTTDDAIDNALHYVLEHQ